jgi:monoamine oxidase
MTHILAMKYSTTWSFAIPILTHLSLIASTRPTDPHYPPVCIIGAGPAGLSAAGRLQEKGIDAIVFEKQEAIGGKCQSYYDEEYVLHGMKFPNFKRLTRLSRG